MFLNKNTSFEWFIDPHLFGLELSSFILLYLIILLGLLVQVLLLISGMINGVLVHTSLANIAGLSDGVSIRDTVPIR